MARVSFGKSALLRCLLKDSLKMARRLKLSWRVIRLYSRRKVRMGVSGSFCTSKMMQIAGDQPEICTRCTTLQWVMQSKDAMSISPLSMVQNKSKLSHWMKRVLSDLKDKASNLWLIMISRHSKLEITFANFTRRSRKTLMMICIILPRSFYKSSRR